MTTRRAFALTLPLPAGRGRIARSRVASPPARTATWIWESARLMELLMIFGMFSLMTRGFCSDSGGNPARDRRLPRYRLPSGSKSRRETVWTIAGENQKLSAESPHTASVNQCPRKANPENNGPDLRSAARKNPGVRARSLKAEESRLIFIGSPAILPWPVPSPARVPRRAHGVRRFPAGRPRATRAMPVLPRPGSNPPTAFP